MDRADVVHAPVPRGKAKRMQQVLIAAESSIRSSGDVSFSMRALAADAEVAFKTPFNLFGSKDNVLYALLKSRLAAQAARLDDLLDADDALAALFGIASESCDAYVADAELYRPILNALGVRINTSLRARATELWRSGVDACEADGLLAARAPVPKLATRLQVTFATSLLVWAGGHLTDDELRTQVAIGVVVCLRGHLSERGEALIDEYLRGLC